MTEADKLFENLGYKKTKEIYENFTVIVYKSEDISIEFTSDKEIILTNKSNNYENVILNIKELQAINLKCKELGWKE